MKVLILGATGMLGNAAFRYLSSNSDLDVYGSIRFSRAAEFFTPKLHSKLINVTNVDNADELLKLFERVRPELVVNCIGIVKQLTDAHDPLAVIPMNAIFPHRLARICAVSGARLVHVSTDCVFSGKKGNYLETDASDAEDMYGRTKLLGEVDYGNAVTLRTSIIGHEINGARSLIGWFLSQENKVSGFTRAIFSGLPTVELSKVINDHVIPNSSLRGLYHVSAEPISKFDLLTLVAQVYEKKIEIEPNDVFKIDRSLNSSKFREVTGYTPPSWFELINLMKNFS